MINIGNIMADNLDEIITVRHKKETIGTFDIATFMDKIKPELNPTGLTTKIM